MAAERIGCMCRREAGLDTPLPRFALMAGSGITSFQAPSLCTLAEQYLLNLGLSLPTLPATFPVRYLDVFSLFHSGWHLQAFLATHLESREPSPGCRELATLVGSNGLTNLILTVNFCDEIPDAVRDLGLDPLVLDQPDEIRQRLLLSRSRLQVVKLHGDYRHFDSCNLGHELKRRGRQVRGKVLEVLSERSMIVLGYSGWAGDAFLPALRYHLTHRTSFPGCVWWFCYSDDDYERLPGWLVNSSYVRVVSPSASGSDFLDARDVLSTLGTEMRRFTEVTPMAAPAAPHVRPYKQPRRYPIASRIYWEDSMPLIDNRDRALREAYYATAENNPTLALALSQERQRLLGTATISIEKPSIDVTQLLEALYSEGYCLQRLGRPEEALAQFQSVATQASFDEPLFRGRHAHARNGEGVVLVDLGRDYEALSIWSSILELPVSQDPQLLQARDFALNNVWLTQRKLQPAAAKRTFVTLMQQLSASEDPIVLGLLERAVETRLAESAEKFFVKAAYGAGKVDLTTFFETVHEAHAVREGREIDINIANLEKGAAAGAQPLVMQGRADFIIQSISKLARVLLIDVQDDRLREMQLDGLADEEWRAMVAAVALYIKKMNGHGKVDVFELLAEELVRQHATAVKKMNLFTHLDAMRKLLAWHEGRDIDIRYAASHENDAAAGARPLVDGTHERLKKRLDGLTEQESREIAATLALLCKEIDGKVLEKKGDGNSRSGVGHHLDRYRFADQDGELLSDLFDAGRLGPAAPEFTERIVASRETLGMPGKKPFSGNTKSDEVLNLRSAVTDIKAFRLRNQSAAPPMRPARPPLHYRTYLAAA